MNMKMPNQQTCPFRTYEYLLCNRWRFKFNYAVRENMNIYCTLGGDLKYPLSTLNYSKSYGPNKEYKRLLCIR